MKLPSSLAKPQEGHESERHVCKPEKCPRPTNSLSPALEETPLPACLRLGAALGPPDGRRPARLRSVPDAGDTPRRHLQQEHSQSFTEAHAETEKGS